MARRRSVRGGAGGAAARRAGGPRALRGRPGRGEAARGGRGAAGPGVRGRRLEGGPGEREVAESRSLLAAALRVRRRRREVTQVRLAALLGSSQSRIAKMEAADRTVSLELLVRGLVALGATRREVGRLVAEGRRAARGGGSHDGGRR